jgi:hypothetical protein
MDSIQLSLIILPPICGIIGYILKNFSERYSEKIKIREQKTLDNIEYKLKEFYYPILSNLIRENSIWNKLIKINDDQNTILCNKHKFNNIFNEQINSFIYNNELKICSFIDDDDCENHRITIELDKEILSIHLDNQKIIQNHLVKINPSSELRKALEKYDDHVTIFNILRKIHPNVKNINNMKYPGQFNAYYPVELREIIEKEYKELKNLQEQIYNSKILV